MKMNVLHKFHAYPTVVCKYCESSWPAPMLKELAGPTWVPVIPKRIFGLSRDRAQSKQNRPKKV